jgi:hypothetical protein
MKFLTYFLLFPIYAFSQTQLQVNGQKIEFSCISANTVFELDTINYQKIRIYHAEINENCLELNFNYGNCNTEMELVTDEKIIETNSLNLYFLFRYAQNSKPCKENNIKGKIKIDLLPYKNMRGNKPIFICLLGERYQLVYK